MIIKESVLERNELSDISVEPLIADKTFKSLYGGSGYPEISFGIDRVVCSTPHIDKLTGEILINIESLKSKLGAFNISSRNNKNINAIIDIDLEHIHIENNELLSVPKIFGKVDSLPINVTIKDHVVIFDISFPKLNHNHNAIQFPISQLEEANKIISDILGINFSKLKLESAEYALGIITDQSPKDIVDSLGEANGATRYPMINGAKWEYKRMSNHIKLYSTNEKNLYYSKEKGDERCQLLSRLSKKGLDIIRVEMKKKYGWHHDILLEQLHNPKFISEQIEFFISMFSRIEKNLIHHIKTQDILDTDFKSALNEVRNRTDLKNILLSIGAFFLYNIVNESVKNNKKANNTIRLKRLLDDSIKYGLNLNEKFKAKEHFHDKVLNALYGLLEYYESNVPSILSEV
jgi:hypothetical protein